MHPFRNALSRQSKAPSYIDKLQVLIRQQNALSTLSDRTCGKATAHDLVQTRHHCQRQIK
jgi:hypothetical protein